MRRPALLALLIVAPLVARADEIPDPVLALDRACASRDPMIRKAALEQVASIPSKAVAEAIGKLLKKDTSPIVRKAAARALALHPAPIATAILADAAQKDEDPDVDTAVEIIEACGRTNSDVAANALVQLLRTRPQLIRWRQKYKSDDILRITSAALDSLAKIGSARSLDGIIEFMKIEQPTYGNMRHRDALVAGDPLLKKADAALEAITGDHREGLDSWLEWQRRLASSSKVVFVFKCEKTGNTYEKTTSPRVECPGHGASCGWLLKTRYENGGLPPVEAPAKKGKKK
jgi:hypothetical protein